MELIIGLGIIFIIGAAFGVLFERRKWKKATGSERDEQVVGGGGGGGGLPSKETDRR